MFIHNAWYVICEPQEIPRGTALARTVLGTKIVLYRTESGQPVAFIDAVRIAMRRCPRERSRGTVSVVRITVLYMTRQDAAFPFPVKEARMG